MKTQFVANTDPDCIKLLLSGQAFRFAYVEDQGIRHTINYDPISLYYWLYKVDDMVPVSWIVGIAKDFVYLNDMQNEINGGRHYGFYLTDVVFESTVPESPELINA